MRFSISSHARKEMARRGIESKEMDLLMTNPGQIVDAGDELVCYQSQQIRNGKTYLLRAIVNADSLPPNVVTVYRTSKIKKYWAT